jgi:hypothetical protein
VEVIERKLSKLRHKIIYATRCMLIEARIRYQSPDLRTRHDRDDAANGSLKLKCSMLFNVGASPIVQHLHAYHCGTVGHVDYAVVSAVFTVYCGTQKNCG